jgi:hypothetical protein
LYYNLRNILFIFLQCKDTLIIMLIVLKSVFNKKYSQKNILEKKSGHAQLSYCGNLPRIIARNRQCPSLRPIELHYNPDNEKKLVGGGARPGIAAGWAVPSPSSS